MIIRKTAAKTPQQPLPDETKPDDSGETCDANEKEHENIQAENIPTNAERIIVTQ